MKTLKKHYNFLDKIYWEQNKQKLYFTSEISPKHFKKHRTSYNWVNILCGNRFVFTIQTLSCVDKDLLGSTPYIQTIGNYILITVKKFGYLTDEDIENAIRRYLKYVGFIAFNLFWQKKQIKPYAIKAYEI